MHYTQTRLRRSAARAREVEAEKPTTSPAPPHLFDYSLNPTDSIQPKYKEHMNTGLNSFPTDPDNVPEEPDNILDHVEYSVDDDQLTFGKYRGQTPNQVYKTDPGWLIWAHKTVTNRVTCTQELVDKCAETVRPKQR